MFALVYISRSTQRFTEAQLVDLLKASREKNLGLGITGLLLYKDGNFMQLLEGEKGVVTDLLQTIIRDTRHVNVVTIFDETVEAREFPNWSMGWKNLNGLKADEVPGYTDFMNVPLSPEEFAGRASRARTLLHLFKMT